MSNNCHEEPKVGHNDFHVQRNVQKYEKRNDYSRDTYARRSLNYFRSFNEGVYIYIKIIPGCNL